MRLVTPHMVRATNMRMIICFMIFLSFCNPGGPRAPWICVRHNPDFLKKEYSFSSYFIP